MAEESQKIEEPIFFGILGPRVPIGYVFIVSGATVALVSGIIGFMIGRKS